MVSANVNRVLKEVVALTLDERQQLFSLLESEHENKIEASPEDLADAALLKNGIISHIPSPPTEADIARFRNFKPVKVEGKPISESLIEDRR